MSVLAGARLGFYQIVSLIGAGGMGEVYRARDTKLGRDVAIKVLPDAFARDAGRLARFQREAQLLAALNHPNIAAIYGLEEHRGTRYLVLEYVPGETLAERIQRGPLPIGETLDFCSQVSEALMAAHENGIIHRDLKPANVRVTPQGRVKVLDFGLAKQITLETAASTTTSTGVDCTLEGTVIGTPAYMSPEQSRGAPADTRSDLFSLGSVVYECLTGSAAFSGPTPLQTLARVLEASAPPPSAKNPAVPPELDQVTGRLLAKRPEERYQSAADLLEDLRILRARFGEQPRPVSGRLPDAGGARNPVQTLSFYLRRPRLSIPLAAAALGVLIAAGWFFYRGAPPAKEAFRFYQEGTTAIRDGVYHKAGRALERAVSIDGDFRMAHARLAEAWAELDNPARAREEMLRALAPGRRQARLSPSDPLYVEAIRLSVMGEYKQALQKYQGIARTAADAEKPAVMLDLGRAYEKVNDTKQAIATFEEAARLDQQSAAAYIHLGALYGRTNDRQKSDTAFQQAEALYKSLSSVEGVAEVYYQRGLLASKGRDAQAARSLLERSLELARTVENDQQQIKALLTLSSVTCKLGDSETARRQAEEGLSLARSKGLETLVIRGLLDLGNVYLTKGRHDDAKSCFSQMLDLARRYKAAGLEARALVSLGSVHMQTKETDQGLRYVEEALPFFEKSGYLRETAQVSLVIARGRQDKKDYEGALRGFKKTIGLSSQLQDLATLGQAEEGIGGVLAIQSRFPEALTHYEEFCRVSELSKNKMLNAYALLNSGSLLGRMGRYTEAGERLTTAKSMAEAGAYHGLLAQVERSLAELALSRLHLSEARERAVAAMRIADAKDLAVQAEARQVLALASALSGRKREAEEACRQARQMAAGMGALMASEALLSCAEVAVKNQQPREALDMLNQAERDLAGRPELEWRAWLYAARASVALKDVAGARQAAYRSRTSLSSLEKLWPPEVYKQYLSRPDLQLLQKELAQLPH